MSSIFCPHLSGTGICCWSRSSIFELGSDIAQGTLCGKHGINSVLYYIGKTFSCEPPSQSKGLVTCAIFACNYFRFCQSIFSNTFDLPAILTIKSTCLLRWSATVSLKFITDVTSLKRWLALGTSWKDNQVSQAGRLFSFPLKADILLKHMKLWKTGKAIDISLPRARTGLLIWM